MWIAERWRWVMAVMSTTFALGACAGKTENSAGASSGSLGSGTGASTRAASSGTTSHSTSGGASIATASGSTAGHAGSSGTAASGHSGGSSGTHAATSSGMGTSGTTGGSGSGSSSGGAGLSAWCLAHASGAVGTSSGASVGFAIDMCKGPVRQYNPPAAPTAVSPYVYGINAGHYVATSTAFGLIRQGGDASTGYNWTNDYSNSGGDYCYFAGSSTQNANLGGRYTDPSGDTIPAAQAKGEAFLATVSILDFVSSNYPRNTGWDSATSQGDVCPGNDSACPSRSGSVRANVVDKFQADTNFGSSLEFAYANDGSLTATGSPAFVPNAMQKGTAFCSCAIGTKSCSGCSVAANPVAQDEFVNFLKVNFGNGGAPIFFDLDNEPNYWVGTHPELYPNNCSQGSVTWEDVVNRDVRAATGIKGAWAEAKTFGPVVAGDGMAYGGDYGSPHFKAGTVEFSDWYLQQLAAASATAGHPLLDVYDVHYYTVGSSDAQCLESPRLFWDPNATDISATDTNSLDFNFGDHSYWDTYWYPRQVIPRLLGKIAAAYSGVLASAPALSFSEYNPGCELAISGGVAEADLLGIFGREGVFAATAWPLQSPTNNYLVAAYQLYRNYDGQGSIVGDTTVASTTTDDRHTAVYGYAHSDDPTKLELVAINKNSSAQAVTVQVASAPVFTSATLFNLVDGSPAVVAGGGVTPSVNCQAGSCSVSMTLPAVSATTVVLR